MASFKEEMKRALIPQTFYGLMLLSNRLMKVQTIGQERLEGINRDTPLLFAYWHCFFWFCLLQFRHQGYYTLGSKSRDGEYISRVAEKLGWHVVRGSSSKGGTKATFQLMKLLKEGVSLFLTIDGPKGPRQKVKPGIVYLQEKSRGVIIPLSFAVDRKKVFNSWDQFVLPYPMARVVINYGSPLFFQEGLSLTHRSLILEEELFLARDEAQSYLNTIKGIDIGDGD